VNDSKIFVEYSDELKGTKIMIPCRKQNIKKEQREEQTK
jgi:hypothetical protein